MSKLLLHTCCGPCTIYPLDRLRRDGFDVIGYFFRDNIHPYTECVKRQKTLEEYAAAQHLRVIVTEGYNVEGFLRRIVFRESSRCQICYHARLEAAARIARKGKCDGFSTTLLYSKYQKHDLIREIGEEVGRKTDIPFYYADFREGWDIGVAESRRIGMYRQSYCGCLFSEKERYYRASVAP